jgi:hypothetical protein
MTPNGLKELCRKYDYTFLYTYTNMQILLCGKYMTEIVML